MRGYECVRGMTKTTLAFSRNVPVILVRGRRSVVAEGAAAGYSAVVVTAVRQAIQEVLGIVAIIALLARRDMVIGFADGHDTVMAFAAATEDFLMIDIRDMGEIGYTVTGLTNTAGRDVGRRFADRYDAVVTGYAVVYHAGMIEQRAREAVGVVAGDAILVCWNMGNRLVSGPGRYVAAVVAGETGTADSLVIDDAANKGFGGVAEVTIQGGGNMPLGFADFRPAVAGVAVVDGTDMIKSGADETAGSVAYAAVLVGLNVLGRFALGEHAVVA